MTTAPTDPRWSMPDARMQHCLTHLSMAVPLWANRIGNDPFNKDAFARIEDALFKYSESLVVGGQGAAQGFNALAEAIARMSFVPGGVPAFGYRWTAIKIDTPKGKQWWVKQEREDGTPDFGTTLWNYTKGRT